MMRIYVVPEAVHGPFELAVGRAGRARATGESYKVVG